MQAMTTFVHRCVRMLAKPAGSLWLVAMAALLGLASFSTPAMAAEGGHKPGGEVNIVLPDLTNNAVKAEFLGGMSGSKLLMIGLIVCMLGMGFGMMIYMRRHPEQMTDLLMRQVESNFAADVTTQEKEDLRSAYDRFRRSLVDGRRAGRRRSRTGHATCSGGGSSVSWGP